MKTIKMLLMPMIILTLIFSMIPTASATFDRVYTARYASPIVDGEIDDVWSAVDWTYVDKAHDGEASTDTVVRVKVLWDESNLYFLAEVVDKSYNPDYDMLEIYLDQTNTKTQNYGHDDSQTRFKLNGKVVTGIPSIAGKNAQTNAEYYATQKGQNTYILETALYYTTGIPQAGNIMGLEFMYQDAKAGLTYVDYQEFENGDAEAYRWNIDQKNGDKAAWESTVHWGTLVFADEDGYVPKDVPTCVIPIITTKAPNTTKTPVTTKRPLPTIIVKDTIAHTTNPEETTDLTSTQETYKDDGNYCGGMPDHPDKEKNRDTDGDEIDNADISDTSPVIVALIMALAAALIAVIALTVALIVTNKKNSKE